jgi:hypothetical protein
MENYFFKIQPVKEALPNPVIDPNLEFATLEDQNNQESNQEAVHLRLENVMNNYLSAPKTPESISKSKKAHSQWEELNSALRTTTQIYNEKKKRDKNFTVPQFMIDNVTQFNNLRLQYILDGTKSPSHAASLATAQSAMSRRLSGNQPQLTQSGIYLARSIAKQAVYVVNHKEIF